MIRADWTTAYDLAIRDGGETVATGRISPPDKSGADWLLEHIVVTPALDSDCGDFLVRLLIRRAYELGAFEQAVYAEPAHAAFYQKLGFARVADLPAGRLIKMLHTGDVTGNC